MGRPLLADLSGTVQYTTVLYTHCHCPTHHLFECLITAAVLASSPPTLLPDCSFDRCNFTSKYTTGRGTQLLLCNCCLFLLSFVHPFPPLPPSGDANCCASPGYLYLRLRRPAMFKTKNMLPPLRDFDKKDPMLKTRFY